jgi:hypothetical protein
MKVPTEVETAAPAEANNAASSNQNIEVKVIYLQILSAWELYQRPHTYMQ